MAHNRGTRPSRAGQILAMVLVCIVTAGFGVSSAKTFKVRKPVWAGKFYPADSLRLKKTISRLIENASKHSKPLPGRLRALVMPHAGYVYCGQTAARAACLLHPGAFDKVILLGPDHRVGFDGTAVSAADAFETPMGQVPVAADATRLLKYPQFKVVAESDRSEHSLEVVLPWLQFALGDFRIIPLVVGRCDPDGTASALAGMIDYRTLVVVSSDLSHYLPYKQAQIRDRQTLEAVVQGRAGVLLGETNRACGSYALAVLLELAKRFQWQAGLLHYANSGDTVGSREAVVGYGAVAFWGERPMDTKNTENLELTAEQGQALVKLARQTLLERFGRTSELESDLEDRLRDPVFDRRCGTFVTLTIDGNLRGCIGTLEGYEPLVEGVRRNAINAAFHDPRFAPLSVQDLDRVRIEVSVLTQPSPLQYTDADDLIRKLRPGVDGVIISSGSASATFLPQVWDQLPEPESFLAHLCMKAGLSPDQWRKGGLEVKTYQVQYFEEPH